jgi:hypothetical protein
MDFQQTNILSMTGNDDFATTADLAGYVDLTTSQTITSGIKTFTTLPQSSAVPSSANQLVNKTYVDGAFCTLGTTQTLTGAKTFNVNVRLNNTRELLFGTSTGGSINYTLPNLYYNITGGSHSFFVGGTPTAEFDTGGLVLRTGKRVQFYAGSYIDENSGGNAFDTNIPSGYVYNFKINSVDKFKIHGTFGCYITDNVNLTTQKYINWTGGSYQQEDSAGLAYVYNVPSTSYSHSFRFANTEKFKISNDANGTLFTFPAGTIMREYTSFNWFLYQMPAPYTLKYQVGGTDILEVSSGGLITYEKVSLRNGKKLTWDEGFTNIAYIRKDNTNNYLEYDVATGYRHRFSVNGVESAFIDATGVVIQSTAVGAGFPNQILYLSQNKLSYIGSSTTDIRYNCSASGSHNFYQNTSTYLGFWNSLGLYIYPNNASLQIGTTNTAQIKHDTATTELQYRTTGSYDHMFYIDGSLYYEMRTDTFRALRGYQNKAGATGAYVSNNFNFSWNTPSASNVSVWIDNTRLGNMSIVSDYRLKENIVPARPVLDRLCKIKMIEYEFKNVSIFKKNGISHGFLAHEVAELFPELINIIHGEKDALTADGDIQPQTIAGEITNLYLSGIQELNAKIEAQQTQMDAMQKQIDGLLVAMSKLVSQQIV